MVDNTEEGLQRTLDRLNKTAKEYDMKINAKKTKTMVVPKKGGVRSSTKVDGKKVQQITKFKYLGAILSEDGRCLEDVKARIEMAKDAFKKRKELPVKRFSKSI